MDFRLLVLVTGSYSTYSTLRKKILREDHKLSFEDVGFDVLKTSKYRCNVDKQDLEFRGK